MKQINDLMRFSKLNRTIGKTFLLIVLLTSTYLISAIDTFANSEPSSLAATAAFFNESDDRETAVEMSSISDGTSTKLTVFGCTDPDANNYDPNADTDDGSCTYDPCELNISILPFCDTLRAVASSNFSVENVVWSINGNPEANNWQSGDNNIVFASFTAELGVPYELCAESMHSQCEDVLCETVTFGEECQVGCPTSQPSHTVVGCTLAVNLDTWDAGIGYTQVYVTGFEGTYTPPIPNNTNTYEVGSTIIFAFDEPGEHEVCLGFSFPNCTQQWYCYVVNLVDCDEEVITGCNNPIATNYNSEAMMNDGSCEYDACNISFEASLSDTDDNLLLITPSSNYVDVISTLWNFGDGGWSYEPYPYHEYLGNGPFNLCLYVTVEIPNDANCNVSYCMEIDASLLVRSGFAIQVVAPSVLSTSEASQEESLQLWPNPAISEVQVGFTALGNRAAQMHIYDLNGRTVFSENWPLAVGSQQIAINTAAFPSGLYLIQLVQGDKMESRRLVVGK